MKRDAATPEDAALAALFGAVERAPWAHDFFALLRRIKRSKPASPRIGRSARPIDDALRLGQEPELDFAPASLASFERAGRAVPRLGVRLFGLLGAQGPMPLHFTEYVRERQRQHGDATLVRFLDVFHHRLLSLFYRAWAQAQPVVQHDRPADDRYAAWLGSTIGLGVATANADSIADAAKLHVAGLLGSRSRHAEGLQKLLRQHFGVPVQVQQHVPQRLAIRAEDRSRLGSASRRRAACLGRDATIGGHVRDRQFRFRVVLGPSSIERYLAFLPGGRSWRELRDWVDLYAGTDLRWDVELQLQRARPDDEPPRLADRPRLGLTSWAGRSARWRDRSDLRLRPATSFIALRRQDKHREATSHG